MKKAIFFVALSLVTAGVLPSPRKRSPHQQLLNSMQVLL
jgi:hypothetical protein